jgi:small subunit ribosomal protein S17
MAKAKVGKKRITKVGIVVSDKMDKTIVVQVAASVRHAQYGKVIKRFNKFKAHDPQNQAKVGQAVRIAETRPLSRDKRWRLVEIVK